MSSKNGRPDLSTWLWGRDKPIAFKLAHLSSTFQQLTITFKNSIKLLIKLNLVVNFASF
jgi:hypothetical protein